MGTGPDEPDPARKAPKAVSDPVEEASVESFPASDPPGWIPLHAGSPAPVAVRSRDHHPARRAATTGATGEAAPAARQPSHGDPRRRPPAPGARRK